MSVYASALPSVGGFRVFSGDSDIRGGALIPFDLLDEHEKSRVDLNFTVHKSLLNRASAAEFEPVAYVDWKRKIVALDPSSYRLKTVGIEGGSSDSEIESVTNRYSEIAKVLDNLKQPSLPDDAIDSGAVETATSIIRQLQAHRYPPPEVSWHGSDAVVMLWALGKTTYAITATDGEIGYVVRRDNRTLKRKDSIFINAFVIENLLK